MVMAARLEAVTCVRNGGQWGLHAAISSESTTDLQTLSRREEVIIANAIHWAGTYYTTTPWQAHDPTTTTSYHDILQST
jgi:hypothetical protein